MVNNEPLSHQRPLLLILHSQFFVNGKSLPTDLSMRQVEPSPHPTLWKMLVLSTLSHITWCPFDLFSEFSLKSSQITKLPKLSEIIIHCLIYAFSFNKYVKNSFHLNYTQLLRFSHASCVKALHASY